MIEAAYPVGRAAALPDFFIILVLLVANGVVDSGKNTRL